MKKSLFTGLLALALTPLASFAAVSIGDTAPNFTLTDHTGQTHSLSDFAGKRVVLEWTNYGCPFVKKHYDSKNMQNLQQEISSKEDVVWLSIISSAQGKQGHLTAEAAPAAVAAQGANAPVLLDESGDVGRAYGAKVTPHMFVIEDGKIAYMGAIDSIPSFDQADIPKADNYVAMANADLTAGEAVKTPSTTPYGCSVKY